MDARLTFREKCPSVCWQKQLRDHYNNLGAPDVPHLDVGLAEVRQISYRLAQQIILRYEWLGTMAKTRLHFGIFFGSFCAGVTCVGSDCTGGTALYKFWNLKKRQDLLFLARGACSHWAPVGTNSKLVSFTVNLLRKMRHGKIIIAYADSDAGEIGTIYQAANWVYTGKTTGGTNWINPLGRLYDAKKPADLKRNHGSTRAFWAQELRNAGWREQKVNPKHRYACLIDRMDIALESYLESLRKPYPKRCAGSETVTRQSNQIVEGGSIPTPALSK